MTTRKILKAFGFETWRQNGRWIAHRPGATFSADYLFDLIEEIIPEPPEILSASALREWGTECKAAVYDADPKIIAQAAFAAYAIDPPDDLIECFISAWDDPQR